MKKVLQFIAVFLAGFFTYGVLDRILRAKAEETFHLERSRCQSILIEHWKQSGGKAGLGTGDNINYFFVDWSKLPDEPGTSRGKYPLIYDRRLSNHDGRGINILMVDGSIVWDSNVDWLKKFAAEHPNAKLPVPE